jgi:hypothetical protein
VRGIGSLAIGLLILTGSDRALEAVLVVRMPPWLVDLTTHY